MIVDSHAHLNHEDLLPEVEEALARAHGAGVGGVVVVGYDLPSSQSAVELAGRLPGVVAAVGLHPYEAGRAGDREIEGIRELAASPWVAAIGEIGFDFHGEEAASHAVQEELARRQFAIASAHRLPVVLHLRDAGTVIEPLLLDFPDVPVVFHCFSGDRSLLEVALARRAYVSFAGPLTYKRNEDLRAMAAEVPLDRLLVETDSPYLAPQGHRGRRNEPSYVVETLTMLATLHERTPDEMAEITTSNALRVFPLLGGSIKSL